jgi:hypothetical protein
MNDKNWTCVLLDMVAHTCNLSYSGGRDQEDHGLKPVWANSLQPYVKTTITKKAGGVAQGGGPEFKLLYRNKETVPEGFTTRQLSLQL